MPLSSPPQNKNSTPSPGCSKSSNRGQLAFDRGTLILKGVSTLPEPWQTHFVWDDRVEAWRGQAMLYAELARSCAGFNCFDAVFDGMPTTLPVRDWHDISLRPYQQAALFCWTGARHRGLVVLPTGAGKTRTALAAMKSCRVPTICLVPTRVLLEQWRESLQSFYSGPVGVLGDGEHRVEAVTVATFESAYRSMSWLGNRFQMVVVDEAHHFGRSLRDEALMMSAAPYRLGLTATTPTDDGQLENLQRLIGPVVFEQSVHQLTGTYLAEFDYHVVRATLDPVERLRYQREYSLFRNFFNSFRSLYPTAEWSRLLKFASGSETGRKAISAFYRARRIVALTNSKRRILGQILQDAKNRKVLVFTADTYSAIKISQQFLIPTIIAAIKRPERKRILEDFATGSVGAIVACKVLDEGIDVPDAEVCVIVGGNANGRAHIQRIGRLLRPHPGKKALIFEIVTDGTHEVRHSKLRRKGICN